MQSVGITLKDSLQQGAVLYLQQSITIEEGWTSLGILLGLCLAARSVEHFLMAWWENGSDSSSEPRHHNAD